MNADNVLPMRPMTVDPADAERLTAYFVAISVTPEVVSAAAISRTLLVNQVIVGMRLARASLVSVPGGRDFANIQAVATLMRQDEAIATEKGWEW